MEKLTLRQTDEFRAWMDSLRDRTTYQRITTRLERLANGYLGDTKPLGGGVAELRFTFGLGYRIYYARFNNTVVLLLCGGDKSSQSRDIDRARAILVGGDWE